MTFKCTCEESRAEEIRLRLLRAALPYCFYLKLLNRPVFEFDSADDMMRAVMATDGQLMMLSSHVPPRSKEKLRLTPGQPAARSAARPGDTMAGATGLFAAVAPQTMSGASLRPAHLAKRVPAKRA